MKTASLIEENVGRYAPVTNHYRCSDGRHLLVTYPRMDVLATIAGLGLGDALKACGLPQVPVSIAQQPSTTDVFLADADGNVLDADGDLSNGMTPLLVCEGPATVEEALAQAGYELTTEET